jgi:hypothetical protein
MSDTDVSIELAGQRSIEGVDHVTMTNGAIHFLGDLFPL